jgi:hypothetical protein
VLYRDRRAGRTGSFGSYRDEQGVEGVARGAGACRFAGRDSQEVVDLGEIPGSEAVECVAIGHMLGLDAERVEQCR